MTGASSYDPPEVLRHAHPRVEEMLDKYQSSWDLPGISRGLTHQLTTGGKRLRPSWTLWLAEHWGANSSSAEDFAMATELLHNVLLIHDDIEDGDRYRRGQKTLWVEVGIEEALNVGDFLLAEAYRFVGQAARQSPSVGYSLHETFTTVFRQTVVGQALDLGQRADPHFTLRQYESIVRQKTGKYLALGWVGAAHLAGREADVDALWAVGEEIGPAFQIRDDLLDLTPGKGRGGEIGCDIREGKPSLLYAYSLERGDLTSADRQRLIAIQAKERAATDDAEVQWVIDLYHTCGAVEFGEAESRRRIEAGIEQFELLSSQDSDGGVAFRAIANYVVERKV